MADKTTTKNLILYFKSLISSNAGECPVAAMDLRASLARVMKSADRPEG
jgi:hypothetical protein